jgi:hypothetical protein
MSNWGLNFNRDLAIVEKLYTSEARSYILDQNDTMKVFFQCIKDQDMSNMLPIFRKASGLHKQFVKACNEAADIPKLKKKRAKVVIIEDEELPKFAIPSHRDTYYDGHLTVRDQNKKKVKTEFYFNYDSYDLVRKLQLVDGDEDMLKEIVDSYAVDTLTLNEIVGLKNYAMPETKQLLLDNYEIDLDKYEKFMPWKTKEERDKCTEEELNCPYYIEDLGLMFIDYDITFQDLCDKTVCGFTKIGQNKYRIDTN